MIAVGVKCRTILGHTLLIVECFIWANRESFEFIGELDLFEICMYNKSIKTKSF